MLKDEIQAYIGTNGLVSNNIVPPGVASNCDNGPMFTGEYYAMLSMLGQLADMDEADFIMKIDRCINGSGMLNRLPVGAGSGQESFDDYFGVLTACTKLNDTSIPRTFLFAFLTHLGFMNNLSPWTPTSESFLARQPQWLAALVAAAFPSKWNPVHLAVRWLFGWWFFYAAVVILVSGLTTKTVDDTDAWRLTWHLIQCTVGSSVLCYLASKVWYSRLYKICGPTGMKKVATVYYGTEHPFARYWVNG